MPHTNVNWSFGPLRYMLVSPAYHRLHHDRDDRRGVNLGTVLVLWDVLAGLAVFPGGEPVRTGLAGRPLPVEQEAGAGFLRTMGWQLWSPVRGAVPVESQAVSHAGSHVESQAVERVRVLVLEGASNG